MSLNILKDIRSAYSQLNPGDVHQMTQKSLTIGLLASSATGFSALENALGGGTGSVVFERMNESSHPDAFDLIICEEGSLCPKDAFVFRRNSPDRTITEILDARPDLEIALASRLVPFRQPVINRVIQRTARENAMFAMVTALPNVIPNLLELPWAVGEFATDTAFLTANQVRMAFLIAAASQKPVGYSDQKMEIATIVAGAFGWRAVARELIGKIPLGGGVIPKGAIAFAGTYVVGMSLERYHRTGEPYGNRERRDVYSKALERGKGVVENLLSTIKSRNAA